MRHSSHPPEVLAADVRAVFAERLGMRIDEVRLDATMADLGVSYGLWLELALAVEEAFDVSLRESELRRARTVGGWVEMLRRAVHEGRASDDLSLDLPPFDELPSELPPPSALPPSSALPSSTDAY
ncbi:MAG: phosphopantetheine-binding protein [Polyangiaceae bacterium]